MIETGNLGNIISNAKARKVIYGIYVVIGIILGATQAWFGVSEGLTPELLSQLLAVYGYLGIPVGGLAIANATNPPAAEVMYTTGE